jgi:hypothetical protein
MGPATAAACACAAVQPVTSASCPCPCVRPCPRACPRPLRPGRGVQNDSAEATRRAVEAETAVGERIAHVNKELILQLAAVERSYEELRRVERQRTQEALAEAASLSKYARSPSLQARWMGRLPPGNLRLYSPAAGCACQLALRRVFRPAA